MERKKDSTSNFGKKESKVEMAQSGEMGRFYYGGAEKSVSEWLRKEKSLVRKSASQNCWKDLTKTRLSFPYLQRPVIEWQASV